MNRLLTWFENTPLGQAFYARSEQDRRVIALVALLFIVSLLWLIAWKPVADWHTDAVARLDGARTSIDYLKANESLARRASNLRSGGESGSLIPLVTRAANAQQLTLNRLQPEAGGILNVVLEEQSFDLVFQWIAQLEQNNGIRARTVSIRGGERSGTINAQIRFHAAGAH